MANYYTSNMALLSHDQKFELMSDLPVSELEEFLFNATSSFDADTLRAGLPLFKKSGHRERARALLLAVNYNGTLECLDLAIQLQGQGEHYEAAFHEAVKSAISWDRGDLLDMLLRSTKYAVDVDDLFKNAAACGASGCLKRLPLVSGEVLLRSFPLAAQERSDASCLEEVIERCVKAEVPVERIEAHALKEIQEAAFIGNSVCVNVLFPWVNSKEALAKIKARKSRDKATKDTALRLLKKEIELDKKKTEVEARGLDVPRKQQKSRVRAEGDRSRRPRGPASNRSIPRSGMRV